MLVTSIFSFSHVVFKGLLQGRQKSGLCGKELKEKELSLFSFCFKTILIKVVETSDCLVKDKLSLILGVESSWGKNITMSSRTFRNKAFENVVEKRENTADQHFLAHLSTMCSRGAFRVTGCPSSVVHRQQFFKHQLLLNRWGNLDQTWQECSLGGPL